MVPIFSILDIKPKSTFSKEGNLTMDDSQLGLKYDGIWNETTNLIERVYTEGNVKFVLSLKKGNPKMALFNRSAFKSGVVQNIPAFSKSDSQKLISTCK